MWEYENIQQIFPFYKDFVLVVLMLIFFNIFTEWKYVMADIEHDSLNKYVLSVSACSPSE